MPLISSLGVMNAINFGLASSSPSSKGFIGYLSGGTHASLGGEQGKSLALDSNKNIYTLSDNPDWLDITLLAKFDNKGNLLWQRKLTGSSTLNAGKITVDSSNNVYVCCASNKSGTTDFELVKFDTNGNLLWQIRLGGSGTCEAYSVKVASSGNIYIGGKSTASGENNNFQLAKYNSSAVLQWQRKYYSTANDNFSDLAIDSSENIYVCGTTTNYSTVGDAVLVKYNSSGVIQWQTGFGHASTKNTSFYGVDVDSSGNVYVCGASSIAGTSDVIINKYNSSGTIQWRRLLSGAGADTAMGICVDSTSVYICGQSSPSGQPDCFIAKYNLNGVIQWQRKIGISLYSDIGYSIKSDDTNSIYICAACNLGNGYLSEVFKLPSDGSLTNSYTVGSYVFNYVASTLTDSANSNYGFSVSLSDTATALTSATSTLTSDVTTATYNITKF